MKSLRDDMGLAPKENSRLQIDASSHAKRLRRYLGRTYQLMSIRIWNHLSGSLGHWHLVKAYGRYLHRGSQKRSSRTQNIGTFFFRNRPELELLTRLLDRRVQGSTLHLTILGCSKGAEVYSFSYSIRSARPDMDLRLHALDIDPDVLEFAEEGIYSRKSPAAGEMSGVTSSIRDEDLVSKTSAGQTRSVFERMSSGEIGSMFDCQGDQARVKPQFRDGIVWHVGDASNPKLAEILGLQDIVVANRFLCHMQPEEAEPCLRSLANLVKPGGYLFVSGVDLEVRTTVAKDLGWVPVTELIEEIHEGDPSLRRDWPLQYWGLEPFDRRRSDRDIRYASVFRLGESQGIEPAEALSDTHAQMCVNTHE
jgi:chemotaxis methyl-accepting protein methylase